MVTATSLTPQSSLTVSDLKGVLPERTQDTELDSPHQEKKSDQSGKKVDNDRTNERHAPNLVSVGEFFENGDGTLPSATSKISLPGAGPLTLGPDDSLARWDSVRDSHVSAHYVSGFEGAETGRAEFIEGARLLGLGTKRLPALHPQQLVVADVLNATKPDGSPLCSRFGVLIPRRSAKTTSVIAVALGRCASREEYRVGFTLATTRDKAAARYRSDIVPPIERLYPDPNDRPFKVRKANGSESLTWPNGSVFEVVTPNAEGFRSEAYDLIIIDEAGEASPEMGEELLAGALATMDTRPGAQIVFTGTAAEFRTTNLLWDVLEDGRAGTPGVGIVEYSASYEPSHEDYEQWENIEPLVLEAHPGIGTLTKLDTIKDRWRVLKAESFSREYLSLFGDAGGTTGVIRPPVWTALALDEQFPKPPERFAMGISATVNQRSGAIVAAWREDGEARVLVLDHREGVRWLAPRTLELARKYNVPVVHDSFGVILTEVEQLRRARPRLKLEPQTTKQVTTAAALFVREVDTSNLRHYAQDALTNAALSARKRVVNVSSWAFGKPDADGDISVLEAASMALRAYDDMPMRQPFAIIVAEAA